MTTDAGVISVTESATIAHEADATRGVLTQGATQIQVPAGAEIVRVQVTPGETLQLPFPQGALVARLDDGNGNLAIKAGDITVILQGYATATGEADVTLIDADGAMIDVAAVVAATDPNLDIATAAGPAAGDQGTGVDNNGGVFSPFDPATGIGGLNAVGGLGATALQYGLIERQAIVFDEDEAAVDTAPVLVTLTPGRVVNEDDLERQEVEFKQLEPFPNHVLDGLDTYLGSGNFVYWAGPVEQGNDPFDSQDHEDGSQVPGLGDDVDGVDQDREPLTSTAVASVNFFADVPGHLSFTNGTTPIIEQLQAMGLTSHSHELLYAVLPGVADDPNTAEDESHGETLVAYYVETYGEGEQSKSIAHVVFTIAFREFEGTDPVSDFNIDFTIYGVVDNVPGIQDADGDILEALDIDVPFFMVDSNGSVTAAPVGSDAGGITFTDVDDVPSFGWVKTEWIDDEGEGEGDVELFGGMSLPTGIVPTDSGIVHDESKDSQDPDDVVPAEYGWTMGWALEGTGWTDVTPLGAAISSISVSFGADGAAEGNWEAGKTAFKGDDDDWVNTDPNAEAFQFVVGGGEIERGATNWTIIGPDGQILVVHALQLDAQTIVGFANPADPDGDGNPEAEGGALAPLSPGSIPVFVVKIDPEIGQVVLVQFHQVNHADTTDGDEATPPLQIFGPGETPTTITFQHDFNDLDGWTTVPGGNAAIVQDGANAPQANPMGEALLTSANGVDQVTLEAFLGLAAGALDVAANDGNDDNGDENATAGTAISRTIDAVAGDTLTLRFNFLDAEGSGAGANWQDFAFVVIGTQIFRLSDVASANLPLSGNANGVSWSDESGSLVFSYTFTSTGPVQLALGVMNEDDTSVSSSLLVDQVLITHGEAGNPVVVRATDYDGDYADLPYEVTIRDDKPSLSFEGYTNQHTGEGEGNPNSGSGYGYLDEDWLKDGNADTDGSAIDDIGGTKSVASLVLTPGTDGSAGLSLDGAAITVSGSVDGALRRSADGAVVKMVTSADGQVVTGYADADQSGDISQAEMIDANKVFSITVVGNTVEFELFQALLHKIPVNDMGEGDVEGQIYFDVPVTLSDGDGDTAALSVNFLVDDDQVMAVDDSTLISTGINVATAGVNLLANDAIGADQPGEVTHVIIGGKEYTLPEAGSKFAIGEDGNISVVGLEIGILEVDRNGEWSFTQTNNAESFEPAAMTFSYRVVDGDGDSDTADFSVQVKHFRAPTFEDETAIVDEDGLPNGDYDDPEGPTNDGTPGDNIGGHQYNNQPDPATEAVFRNTLGNGFKWYGDVGTLKFSFENDAQLSGVVFTNGATATLGNIEGNGTDHLTIWDGVPGASNKVLELTVIDPAEAVYEVKLWSALQHPVQDDPTTPEHETGFEDDINIPVTVTATNFGGAVEHTLTVRVDDDFMRQWGWSTKGPGTIYNGDLYRWIDEDFLANGNQDKDYNGNDNWDTAGDDPELNGSPGSVIATNTAEIFLDAIFGADGPGDLPYGLQVLTPGDAFGTNTWGAGNPLETTLGSSLKVLSSSATSLVISDMSGNPVMTLTCDRVTGAVNFTLHQALDHRGDNAENDVYLRFGVTYTDGDGDVRNYDIGFAIDDDRPETKNSTSGLSVAVDENDMGTDGTTNFAWMFHPVKYGADGPGTTSYKLGGVDGQPLADTVTTYRDSASGEFIKLHQVDSNTIEGRTQNGGQLVFVVKLEGQLVKFDLQRGVDHSGAEFDVMALALPIHMIQVAKDLDGDSAIAVATTNMVVTVQDSKVDAKDDGLFTITQVGKYDGTSLAANDKFGADGPGRVTKVTINNNDYPMVGASVSIGLTGGTLTVNEDGTWYFNQPSLVPFQITYNFSYTISDGDGDTDTATFSLRPAVGQNEAPVANGDLVISLATGTTTIPEWALLRNDTDKEGAALDVTNVVNFVSGTGASNAGTGTDGHVFFNDTGPTGGATNGSFTYQATDGSTTSADATVSIDVREVTNAFGTDNSEIIIGNDKNNQLVGQGGNDIILGGIGNDELSGGSGIDWLFGESGDDRLIYDSQDKFDGSTGDDSLYSNIAGSDFDFKSRSADGSHRMTDIEWVNLGDNNDAVANKVSIALNDVLDVNIASVGSPDGNIHQIDLFVVGDHEGATKDGVDLTGFTRLDVNGATGGFGTFNNTVVTGTSHDYQIWQGTNNLGQTIKIAIEDGLNVVAS